MFKKIDPKTVKVVAQVVTFVVVSAAVTYALNNCIPTDKASKIAYRIGSAIIWGAAVKLSVDGVGRLIDDTFAVDEPIK